MNNITNFKYQIPTDITEVLEYYEGLWWYDSDIFDDELCRLLKRWRKRK